MKCFWRIILAIISLGVTEVLRHKDHNKKENCPLE